MFSKAVRGTSKPVASRFRFCDKERPGKPRQLIKHLFFKLCGQSKQKDLNVKFHRFLQEIFIRTF